MNLMVSHPIKIKICGMTSLDNVLKLDSMGVDYLGFNFWPKSKRYISAADAGEIIKKLKYSVPVGIFVDEDMPALRNIVAKTGIKLAQLHGKENADYISRVPIPVIKALPDDKIGSAGDYITPNTAFVLFDTRQKKQFGGTGAPFNWKKIQTYQKDTPYFLAGGLSPDNLSHALKTVSPYAVDLNSGVEISPGVKDIDKIKKCLDMLRRR